jgi:hypothetical protein
MFHQTSFTYTRAELETLTTCVKIKNLAKARAVMAEMRKKQKEEAK